MIWWMRRDLRLADNPALLKALESDSPAAVFAWTPAIEQWSGRRRRHLAATLNSLQERAAITVRSGEAADVVLAAARERSAATVWAAREYSPAGVREQDAVAAVLAADGRALEFVGSPYAVAPGRVLKGDGTPYAVFTPFSKAWRVHGWRAPAATADPTALQYLGDSIDLAQEATRGAAEDPLAVDIPHTEDDWQDALEAFVDTHLAAYPDSRDRPDLDITSRLSIAMALGQLHPRTILAAVADAVAREPGLARAAEVFTSELAWREFHADVLHHYPSAQRTSLKPVVPDEAWASGPDAEAAFALWQQGLTGFPLVDAGMRELAATGTMHNRVRMVVASFLVKDLHLPWQRGADHFRDTLLDYDHAQNQLNWQWVAGTGRDAAPYFRVFNPTAQFERFDPQATYVKRWVPEYQTAAYPSPMVDHATERDIALADYRAARSHCRDGTA
jgi:deoxyribodipyrimidine photo-lyase